MDEVDLFRNFRRGVAAVSADAQRRASARLASALDEGVRRERVARVRHGGRRRRLVVLAAAVLVVVVGTASAFGTVRGIFGEGQRHVEVGVFECKGKQGSLQLHLLFPSVGARSWKVVRGTGQYAKVTGGGRIPEVGGHAGAWRARLVGFLTRPDAAKQRVAIAIRGRPKGVFALAPRQSGALRRDSGTQSSPAWYG